MPLFDSNESSRGILFWDEAKGAVKMFDSSAASQHFDVREVAARLGIAQVTLYRMIAARQIEHLRVGSGAGQVRLKEAQINDYLQRPTDPIAQAA